MTRTLRSVVRNGAASRAVFAAALCSALAGCGASAPLFTSDGRPTTLVQCPAQGPVTTCTDNARGICGGGIDIVRESTDNGARSLVFACKPH
jgi:hypothetical protein